MDTGQSSSCNPSQPLVLPFPGALQSASSPPHHPSPAPAASSIPHPIASSPSIYLLGTDGKWSQYADQILHQWKASLTNRLNACQDMALPFYPTLRARFYSLIQACEQKDIHYIFLHQMYSLWSRGKAFDYMHVDARHHGMIDNAFATLAVLLVSNDVLPSHQLDWFTFFPVTTLDVCIPSPCSAILRKSIVDFLFAFSSQWQTFHAQVVARGFPLVPSEANTTFHCSSPVIQNAIFVYCRRILGCSEEPLASQLTAVFNKARNFDLMLRSNPSMANRTHHTTTQELARQYLDLIHRARLQMTTWQFQPPLVTGTASQNLVTTPTPTSTYATINFQTPLTPSHPLRRSKAPTRTLVSTPGFQKESQQTSQHGQQGRIGTRYSVSPHHLLQHPTPPPNVEQRQFSTSSLAASSVASATVAQNSRSTPVVSLGTPAAQKVDLLLSRGNFARINVSEYPASAHGLASIKVGLHLARDRSPRRLPINPSWTRFYQYVNRLMVLPTKIDVSQHLFPITFPLSKEDADSLPVEEKLLDGFSMPITRFQNRTCRFRLRVCRFKAQATEIDESQWANQPTMWPEWMNISVNSKPCTLRRKQYFHTDLPLELTSCIEAGSNAIKISLPKLADKESGSDYYAAVERIIIQSLDELRAMVDANPHEPITSTMQEIKRRLGPSGTEEVFLMGGSFNVSVFCPLSRKLCDTPVRGASCKHTECFDLENWLQSRLKKPGGSTMEPCLVDCWRCPCCHGDARPGQLRVSDYFAAICKELARSKLADTEFIAINAQGAWKPRVQGLDSPWKKVIGGSEEEVVTRTALDAGEVVTRTALDAGQVVTRTALDAGKGESGGGKD